MAGNPPVQPQGQHPPPPQGGPGAAPLQLPDAQAPPAPVAPAPVAPAPVAPAPVAPAPVAPAPVAPAPVAPAPVAPAPVASYNLRVNVIGRDAYALESISVPVGASIEQILAQSLPLEQEMLHGARTIIVHNGQILDM